LILQGHCVQEWGSHKSCVCVYTHTVIFLWSLSWHNGPRT